MAIKTSVNGTTLKSRRNTNRWIDFAGTVKHLAGL
ncbi:hypothetical protein M2273_001469 [Mucilaginibacter lappiensis]